MKRLKIVEQLIIVLIIAVILPLAVAALIVTNVNQHAVREELRYSASITADSIYQRLLKSIEERKLSVAYIADSLAYIKSPQKVDKFLKEIRKTSSDISDIEIINGTQNTKLIEYYPDLKDSDFEIYHDISKNILITIIKVNENKYLKEVIDLNKLEKDIFKPIINDKRQIYIIDSKKNILMSYNPDLSKYKEIISHLPKQSKWGKPLLFGKSKNEPHVLLKIEDPDWSIIVVTPKSATRYGIIQARFKILLAIIIAALSIILLCAAYTYSLYTNIRQLFKAITAIGKGNYSRRIRPIIDWFTPYEVLFLTDEFNKMTEKVDNAYKEIQENNERLASMDKFKSNLIDTVSHEFRTPLTSIKGYTSSLLRNDINLDQETKHKSLRVIKQQAERLERLVEDLLVIPDIESSLLRLFPDEVIIKEIMETCILSINQKQPRSINLAIEENLPSVYADPDRVEQIMLNLLDNAVKYSPENSEININTYKFNDSVVITIQNECDPIPEEKLNSLFDKFTRIDDNLTRTTRGTGLGLFIVKGLVEAMGGKVSLSAKDGFEVKFTLPVNQGS